MPRKRYGRKRTAHNVAPSQSAASTSVLKTSCEAHLASTLGENFAEICWCLSDRDMIQLATAAKVLKASLVDAGKHFRASSELLFHDSLDAGGIWCFLPAQEVATYLRGIAPLSVTVENNVSIRQCSRYPPFLARRIHSSLLNMCRSVGESIDPMVLTLASFSFLQVDIQACLHLQAEPLVRFYSVDVVSLPFCNLKLHMTSEVSDLQDMELGINDREVPMVELSLDLDSDKRSQWPEARDRGEYAIMARALPYIGTERQFDIRRTEKIAINGARFASSRPRELSEDCWIYHALGQGRPLLFFVAVWRAEPGSSFEDFL